MQIQILLLDKVQGSDASSSTRAELLESPQYIEPVLGPWAILCHDTDRTIERLGRSAWIDTCTWKSNEAADSSTKADSAIKLDLNEHSDALIAHLRTILLSPSPSYALSMTAAHAIASGDPTMSRTSSGYATPSAIPETSSETPRIETIATLRRTRQRSTSVSSPVLSLCLPRSSASSQAPR